MYFEGEICGVTVDLRCVVPQDAAIILDLRQDGLLSRFLPSFTSTVEQQVNWIKQQQEKQGDYYFLILDKAGEGIGTISIYDVRENAGEAGRFVSRGNELQNVEAGILNFDFAFVTQRLAYLRSEVVKENGKVIRYNQRMGVVYEGERMDARGFIMRTGRVTQEDYLQRRSALGELVRKAAMIQERT